VVSVSACRCSWTRLGFRIVKKTALVESIETDQSGSLEAAFTEKPLWYSWALFVDAQL
jgi:hypothetical protein